MKKLDTGTAIARLRELMPTLAETEGMTELEVMLASIDYIDSKIDELKRHRAEAKNRLGIAVEKLARYVSDDSEQAQRLMTGLYWYIKELSTAAIGAPFGVPGRALSRTVAPYIITECRSCGGPVEVSSRTQLQSHQPAWNECDQCQDARFKHSRHDYEEKRRQQADHIESLRAMPYRQYLQTEHWQNVRRRALRRAGFKCQLCNSGGQLDVHHRTYERRGCEEDSDVIVLCRDCHATFHGVE